MNMPGGNMGDDHQDRKVSQDDNKQQQGTHHSII